MEPSEIPTAIADGRYTGLEAIARGGMGWVFKAHDGRTDQVVAVKFMDDDYGVSKEWQSRFLAEGTTMAVIQHTHVLRVVDVGVEQLRWPYLVMEFASGGSLYDRCVDGEGVQPMVATRHVFDMLSGLAAAHRVGVIHRDVKPANVLFTEDDTLKLADFGLAKVNAVVADVDHRTRTGQGLGTEGYAAPEARVDARSATPATDIYAVGATLFTVLRGYEPPDLSLADADARMFRNYDPELVRIILRATAERPEDRYPTAREMALDVARAHHRFAGGPDETDAWMARFDASLAQPAARRGCAGFLPRWAVLPRKGV